MPPRLALYLLGPPKVELDYRPIATDRRKTLALLVYLAVNRESYSREYLSALLWPEYKQEKAFANLRHTLWETQQAIGDGWISAVRDSLGLNQDVDIWLDIDHFQTLITDSRAQTDISLRISLLTDSAKIYRNHFLTGFSLKGAPHFNDWTFSKSEELRHQLAGALITLSDDLCSLGQAIDAIPYAQRLITLDPLNEASHRQLMNVFIQAGQHNSALKQYQICEKILRKELNVGPQPETRALYKQIRKGEIKSTQPAAQKEFGASQHNLPFQLSKFIGREKELREITRLIADNRLVTLVGTGGIGKTRLSLRAAEGLVNGYVNGVWFVELAPLSDPTLVPQTVAKLFNLLETAGESLTEKLIRTLQPRKVLLILDNCEHVLEACTRLADVLLKNCPHLKILATSREPMRITGEALYKVPPLGLPDIQQLLEQLLGYESVQLFEERARLVQEQFALTMENASSIAHICRRLDGIPLAIELAAARVNLLSTEQIALRLDENFNLLTGGSRTALPRHQTLRASINWSWDLLSEPERMLLPRLSIFAGGWTLDAAESVCGGNGIEPAEMLDIMTQLVAKSLVVVNQEMGREKRYRLLEMIREYARERLAVSEEEQVRNQHLKYFLHLSDQIERELVSLQQMEWYDRTNNERDNIRTALEHAIKTNKIESGLYISARLRNFWEYYDNSEGVRWLTEFLQKPESSKYPVARAKALYSQGWFMATSNQFDAAHAAAQECLALSRASGDQYSEVDGLYLLGFISEGDKKTEYCQQALALARALGDPVRQAAALNFIGWDHSDLKRAFAAWEEAISLFRQMGNRRSLANCLGRLGFYILLEGNLEKAQAYLDESTLLYQQLNINTAFDHINAAYAQIALMRGDYQEARARCLESVRIAKEVGSRMDSLWAHYRLGVVELRAGNITEARQILTDTARAFQEDEFTIGIVITVQYLASLLISLGRVENAARLIGWADRTREAIRNTRPFLEQADVDQDVAAIIASIGSDAFEEAYHMGSSMTSNEAVALALDNG